MYSTTGTKPKYLLVHSLLWLLYDRNKTLGNPGQVKATILKYFNCILKAKVRRDHCHATEAAELGSLRWEMKINPFSDKPAQCDSEHLPHKLFRWELTSFHPLPGAHHTPDRGTLARYVWLNINPPSSLKDASTDQ